MRGLPIILPFTMGVFDFRDARALSSDSRGLVQESQRRMIEEMAPEDLLCRSSMQVRRVKARVAELDRTDPDAATAERLRLVSVERARHNSNIGDFHSVTFGVRRNGRFFGGWQWYNVKRLEETSRVLRVSAGWIPAYPAALTMREVAKRSVDMVQLFLNQKIMMADGREFDLVAATAPFVDDGTEKTRVIREMLAEFPKRADLDAEITDKGDLQTGRTAVVLRKRVL